MKTLNLIIFTGFILAFPDCGFSQAYTQNNTFETGSFMDKNKIVFRETVVSNLAVFGEKTPMSASEKPNNEVYITQIGKNNIIQTDVSSSDAIIELQQEGRDNVMDIDLKANRVRYKIIQNGNGNGYNDYVMDPTKNVTVNLVQEGNDHIFEKFGANSIGNKLKFEMTGESETIIVRNFQ